MREHYSPFGLLPFRRERGLEPLGKWRKEFGKAEGPLRAERTGASESLGWGEVSMPLLRQSEYPAFEVLLYWTPVDAK